MLKKKAKQQWDTEKPKIQAARQKRENHDVLSDEVEAFARKKLENPVEPAMLCEARWMEVTLAHDRRWRTREGLEPASLGTAGE